MHSFDHYIQSSAFLVTGGAGFIGSNLVAHLLKHNAKMVVVLDDLSTGFYKNIEPFTHLPNFTFIEGDIRNAETCNTACTNIDYVLHQAALGSVPRSVQNPLLTNSVNIDGFLNMLVAARDAQVKRFVYAASSSTYGDSTILPKQEQHIGMPLSPYAVTKYVNELYAHVFALNYGMQTIGLRYFNVFGPKQDPNGAYAAVIPLYIQAAIENRPSVINGDGMQTRDFTYVSNAVDANMCALFVQNAEAVNQVYNVAVGGQTSIKQLYEKIQQLAGKNIQPEYGTSRQGDVRDSLADLSKIKQLLGYTPAVDIDEGLKRTFDWFAANQSFIKTEA